MKEKCINFDLSKSLFINYDIVNQEFVDDVLEFAKELSVIDIFR